MKIPEGVGPEEMLVLERERKILIMRRIGQVIAWSVIGVVGYLGMYRAFSYMYEKGGHDLVNRLLREGAILWSDGMPVIFNGETVAPLATEGIRQAMGPLHTRS